MLHKFYLNLFFVAFISISIISCVTDNEYKTSSTTSNEYIVAGLDKIGDKLRQTNKSIRYDEGKITQEYFIVNDHEVINTDLKFQGKKNVKHIKMNSKFNVNIKSPVENKQQQSQVYDLYEIKDGDKISRWNENSKEWFIIKQKHEDHKVHAFQNAPIHNTNYEYANEDGDIFSYTWKHIPKFTVPSTNKTFADCFELTQINKSIDKTNETEIRSIYAKNVGLIYQSNKNYILNKDKKMLSIDTENTYEYSY